MDEPVALSHLARAYPRAHFVGVAGSGMAGLAEVLAAGGIQVSGSDLKQGRLADHLSSGGVAVASRHRAANVPVRSLLVHTAAVSNDHPEVAVARRRGQTILARGELLALLMQGSDGVAVAGSHGKSSTSGMVAMILEAAGIDPWAVIGARLPGGHSHARIGRSSVLVAEVDESDGTIDRVRPWVCAITNVDREHLSPKRNLAALKRSFREMGRRVPVGGRIVASSDDPGAREVTRGLGSRLVTCGLAAGSDLRAELRGSQRGCPTFDLRWQRTRLGRFQLSVPGAMNLKNALVAAGVALAHGVTARQLASGLRRFSGMGRRFERRGTHRGVAIVDDYAHHPREVSATLAAARAVFPHRRLKVLFEPHRPSRLARHLREFARELAEAEEVMVTPVYGAFESSTLKAPEADDLAAAIRRRGTTAHAAESGEHAVDRLAASARRRDVILVMGAGNAERLTDLLVSRLDV